jgi:hypothetical protein
MVYQFQSIEILQFPPMLIPLMAVEVLMAAVKVDCDVMPMLI